MQAGNRVTVEASVVVFNHPEHRGKAFDMKGQTGEVANVLNDWKGRVISPTPVSYTHLTLPTIYSV